MDELNYEAKTIEKNEVKVWHWTDIQSINYSIKPTLEMAYLRGEIIPLKILTKGEQRGKFDPELRHFLFDREYVRAYFTKNIFNPCVNLTANQFLNLLCEFYGDYIVNIKGVNPDTSYFLGEDGFKIYMLRGKKYILIDDLLNSQNLNNNNNEK